jgi:uncharacterized protein (TIGR00730 family)
MAALQALCVYCGSRVGDDPMFVEATRNLGHALARERIRLIYGGGGIGLMGELARAVLERGGEAVGIIPSLLEGRELAQTGLSRTEIVPSMHARKLRMFELSDAFAVLPGGAGTLDETLEMLTWAQLGLHEKPMVLVNLASYWQPLLQLLEHIVARDFAGERTRSLYSTVANVADVIPSIRAQLASLA